MRMLGWILALFAAAVGITLAARYNAGYALFVWPPYRVELTLNLFIVLAVAAFAGLYLLMRLVAGALGLPARVRAARERRRAARGHGALNDALRAFLEGRFGRARKAADIAGGLGESPGLAGIIAARASQELRDYAARDAALARVEKDAPHEVALRVIAQAEMLLAERRPQDALTALAALGERHTAALRLELRAHRELKHWDEVLRLTAQLESRGVFDAEQAAQLRRAALVENLKRKALDAHALEEYWSRLPAADRRDARVALAAAQCFAALGGCAQAHAAIEASLEREWDPELAAAYGECLGGDALAQLERAERWLEAHPHDAMLLLTLGRLCAHRQLWGKAQNYLEASVAVEPTWTAHLALAELHERLGAADAARRHYRASLDLALAQLRESGGGRRRQPL